jgi:hypothetical protein
MRLASRRSLRAAGLLVMPGEGNRCGWQQISDQVGDQGGQVDRVNGFAGRGQFGLSPPAVATVVATLELIQPSGVYLVTGDAVEEEVIAEQPAGPPQVGAAGRIRDRVQVGACDGEPDFLAQLARCGFRETSPDWTSNSRSEASSSSTRADLRVNSVMERTVRYAGAGGGYRPPAAVPRSDLGDRSCWCWVW